MALRNEQTDILGGPILQRPESGVFATFSQYHLVFKSVALLGVGLLVWIACARVLEYLQKHRELRYRKAMRRKHGIPDSDCRPFAVAYAAAKRVHLEHEAQNRKKAANYVSDHNPLAIDQRTDPQKDACLLRKRVPETKLHDYHSPRKHTSPYDYTRPEVHALNFTSRYHPSSCRVVLPEPLPVETPSVCRASRKGPVVNLDKNEESRKRSFEYESDIEHETLKKSRIDGDELMDGDERANWYAQYSDRSSWRVEPQDRRPEDDYVHTNGDERPGCADDLRNEDHELDEAMEGVDEDGVAELKAVARGKKRDRAEAGSTFGGDDEEDIRNGRASHHRKRRTISQRRLEIPVRGQKRDREVESPESDGDGVDSEGFGRRTQRSKKKKGDKAASGEVSEPSTEDRHLSTDARCGGRRVGDSWEADGVQYKVGDKGERLRLTLVKKARNKYHMPEDSQHPDRSAALEIYVEKWMTEEQYKQAEVRQELAWQELPREPSGSKTPDALDSPTKNGKNLLWDSVKCSPARRPFHQFISPSPSPRINPFEQRQSQHILGRRVASSSTIVSPVLLGADSPMLLGFRGFSKWEKQDREAEALARIRAKVEEQKKAQASPQKSLEVPKSATSAELGIKLSVPTITLTPAPAVVVEGKSDDSIPHAKSNNSTFSLGISPDISNSNKGTASTSTTGLSPSFTSTPTPTPSILHPSAPTAPSTTPASNFPFAKPPQVPSYTMQNTFGKVPGVGTSSSSASLPSMLGATTQPQLPSGESVPKPVPFSFGKPDTSSPPPAVVHPLTAKSQGIIFDATSTSPPVTFGFTPATTKPEIVVPPVSTSATSESSKPVTPLFSFSGASSSTATPPALSTPSASKFSFGQPSTVSTLAPGSNPTPGSAFQTKPTFKFGQTLPSAIDGAPTVSAADDSKKSDVSMVGLKEPAKPSPFGTTSGFGSSTFRSPAATDLFEKPAAVDSGSLTSTAPRSSFALTSATTSGSTTSSAPAVAPTFGNAPAFSFGGNNSSPKSGEGSKPVPLFGGAAVGSTAASTLSNSTDGKPKFTFSGNIETSKVPPVFGSSAEGPKSTFAFGGPVEAPKAAPVSGGRMEGLKPAFAFGGGAENKVTSGPAADCPKATSLPTSGISNTTDPSKATLSHGGTTSSTFSSGSPFTFGKDDTATASTSIFASTQAKPASSFSFGAPSGATVSIFGQPSTFATSGDSSQSIFGKPTNTTPNAFGFTGTSASSSSNTYAFGKPAAQNQKQEQ